MVGTSMADGSPQVTPVWCDFDNGHIRINSAKGRTKDRNLRRDPSISLCVDGGRDDTRYVIVYGTTSLIEPGADGQEELRRAIIRKYHQTPEAGDAYYESAAKNPAAIIVISPEKILIGNF